MQHNRPLPLDTATSYKLSKVRQTSTSAELIVRSCLFRLGYRFRISCKSLPGSPDIVNLKKKWVIFVHGCFWHHHQGCSRATVPKNNQEFWLAKFDKNRERDAIVSRQIEEMGYTVVTIWECEARIEQLLISKILLSLPKPRKMENKFVTDLP